MSKGKGVVYTNPLHGSPYWTVTSPSSVGVITAAALALGPRQLKLALPGLAPEALSTVPSKIYLIAAGFALGFASTKFFHWLRWEALRQLFSYHGWMYGGRSMKNQVWALLVKLLLGPKPHSTYHFQDSLPKQPLPSLDSTLDTWMRVSKQFLTADEHEETVQAIEAFKSSDGPKVQAYLQEKSQTEENWVSGYWLYGAYLSCRDPLAILSNYFAASVHGKPVEQLARAASLTRFMAGYEEYLSQERIPPVLIQGMVPLCMNSYRNVFGTVRRPEEHMDTMSHYNKRHIVVIRKGRYFKMDLCTKDENDQSELLSTEQIYVQFERIVEAADAIGEEKLQIADLTAQKRNVWAKSRNRLMENNEKILEDIETSLFAVSLDTRTPSSPAELSKMLLAGNGGDIWFDKGFTAVFYPNGWGGMNIEHSTIDAMVFGSVKEIWMATEDYPNGTIEKSSNSSKGLQTPELLDWDLTGMEKDIETATEFHKNNIDDLDLEVYQPEYGKGYMKKKRLSPDGYIQMAMQLAFYREHKEFPKTYEPSTCRFFALGRTETIHPSSPMAVKWVKAMDGDGTSREDTIQLLGQAIKAQNLSRLKSTEGEGCDRHLLALYCASRELGMDIPAIFLDKAWRKGFRLSTSQTPNKLWEMKAPVNYAGVNGGFGPAVKDGYGVSYPIYNDDLLNFAITSWRSCPETGSQMFANRLTEALKDMKDLLQ